MKNFRTYLLVLATAIFLVCCAGCGIAWPAQVVYFLGLGWAPFLGRVIPDMTVDWAGVATALLALTGLALGLHLFLRWLSGNLPQPQVDSNVPRRPWQRRWTASILGVVVLMFIAGIAAVGMTHQTTWLVTSPEPLIDDGIRYLRPRDMSRFHLGEMAFGLHSHNEQHKSFPAGGTFDKYGRGLHGWQTDLLPYIEQDTLFKHIKLNLAWHDAANAPFFATEIPAYQYHYPSVNETHNKAGFALSHYASNVRVLGGGKPLRMPKDFPDGTSYKLLLGEAAGNYLPWGHHANWRDPALGINTTLNGFGNPDNPYGAIFAMADGSTRSISSKVSPNVLKALSTPAGGEQVREEDLDRD
jgi:hypothetical protein